ncbi:MAG: outer membrane lipoprotein carrier protein LolA [Rhodovibrionaceae bacterium]|nr:outer membrane lipoprotein carrier protein LolA [Rhodovibrionaceae bacterium]
MIPLRSPFLLAAAALSALALLTAWPQGAAAQQSQSAEEDAAPGFLDAVPAREDKVDADPGGSIIEGGDAAPASGEAAAEGAPEGVTKQPRQAAALSPDDVAAVRRIEDYLNGLKTIRARFIQTSSDGTIAEGTVRLKRPGRMRFEYDPPIPIIIVSNGNTLLYYDQELEQTTYVPLWETPLWFLVKEQIDISESDLTILDVEHGAGVLRVHVTDRDQPQLGTISLDFSDNPVQLRRWRVRDAQGTITQVSLVNPEFGVNLDSDLFDYSELNLPKDRGAPAGN